MTPKYSISSKYNHKKGTVIVHVRREGGGDRGSGPPPLLKNHTSIGFLSNTGSDPQKKNHKASMPMFIVGSILARQRVFGI